MNLTDYQKTVGHARDPLELVGILRGMEPGWVREALEVASGMDCAAFEEWQNGLVKERADVWNPPSWYGRYGDLLNPPAYSRAMSARREPASTDPEGTEATSSNPPD